MTCELLRTRLNEITGNGKPETHPCLIDKLSCEIPHSIKVLTKPESDLNFNCVMYAFGIEDIPQRIQLPKNDSDYFYADTHFVQNLINKKYMIEEQQADDSCVIVYSNNYKIRHIGRLISESRVISKWGLGHLYEHNFFESPSDYGDKIRFFRPPSRERTIKLFRSYACYNGYRFFKND
ncbi:MAG: hypothetical protein LM522_09405 [Candidatus Contendobacter sp.]|nr:hypothetical protein [Candidatus Contendobacter sp.]